MPLYNPTSSSTGTSGGLTTVMNIDFTTQPNQNLPDGAVTIGSYTGKAFNNAAATATMSIVNGSGLRIQPIAATDVNNSWGIPSIVFPFSGLVTGTQSWAPPRRYRVWSHLGAANVTTNYDCIVMGASRTDSYANSPLEGYVLKRGFGTSGQGMQGLTHVSGTNVSGFLDVVTGLTAASIVQVIEVSNQWVAFGYGAWSGDWPALSAITWGQSYRMYNLQDTANSATMGGFLSAQRAASGTALTVDWANMRIDLEVN